MAKSPFIPGLLYKRSLLHDEYGGNRQRGISPSAKFPYIFIFSGKSGSQYGYQDEWLNDDIFQYTGEGQIGDMQFTEGNLTLRDHKNSYKRVFLFEIIDSGMVKFESEMEYFDSDNFETPDRNGNIRIAIRFFLNRIGYNNPIYPDHLNAIRVEEDENKYLIETPIITERSGLVTSRVGQGAYRKSIIHRWKYKCAVTGFNNLKILIASHIVPWSESNDFERRDVNNGILLSPTYDALFDRHLISFDNKGKIILTDQIDISAYQKLGVSGHEQIKGLNDHNLQYLSRHNQTFFQK